VRHKTLAQGLQKVLDSIDPGSTPPADTRRFSTNFVA
jgi:hypothetical protein